MSKAAILVRVEPSEREAINSLAKACGLSVNQIAAQALRERVEAARNAILAPVKTPARPTTEAQPEAPR